MAQHVSTEETSHIWSCISNDPTRGLCALLTDDSVGVVEPELSARNGPLPEHENDRVRAVAARESIHRLSEAWIRDLAPRRRGDGSPESVSRLWHRPNPSRPGREAARQRLIDTCVYHLPGIWLLMRMAPIGNIVLAS